MPVHRRVPIVAAIKRWSQLPRGCHVRIAGHGVADLVGVFLVDTREGELCKSLCSFDIELIRLICSCSACHEEQEKSERQELIG